MSTTTMEQAVPRPGETFVWMEASPGEWDETLEQVEEVEGPGAEAGTWYVRFTAPAVEPPAGVFPPALEAKLRRPHSMSCVIGRNRDGRWHVTDDEGNRR